MSQTMPMVLHITGGFTGNEGKAGFSGFWETKTGMERASSATLCPSIWLGRQNQTAKFPESVP